MQNAGTGIVKKAESNDMERAARIHKYGPPEVLEIEPIDIPSPGPGEALIRHTAIGLNFVGFRRGTFQRLRCRQFLQR